MCPACPPSRVLLRVLGLNGWRRAAAMTSAGAHTGNDETCPRRQPAPPAYESLWRRAPRSACRAVRGAGPGTHDKYGLGRVVSVEDDATLIIDFAGRLVR